MRLTDVLSDSRSRVERRTSATGHRLEPGASAAALANWQARWPRHPRPADLRVLLGRVNGIHLWADLATGRSYEGLAPLDEWDLGRVKMYASEGAEALLPDRYLAVFYQADHSAHVVLNADTGTYYLMDAAGPDESCPIGRTAGELLDWLWEHRISLHSDRRAQPIVGRSARGLACVAPFGSPRCPGARDGPREGETRRAGGGDVAGDVRGARERRGLGEASARARHVGDVAAEGCPGRREGRLARIRMSCSLSAVRWATGSTRRHANEPCQRPRSCARVGSRLTRLPVSSSPSDSRSETR